MEGILGLKVGVLRKGERRQIPGVQFPASGPLLFPQVQPLLEVQVPTSGPSTLCVLPSHRFSLLMCPDLWYSGQVGLKQLWLTSALAGHWTSGAAHGENPMSLLGFYTKLMFVPAFAHLLPWSSLCSGLGLV